MGQPSIIYLRAKRRDGIDPMYLALKGDGAHACQGTVGENKE